MGDGRRIRCSPSNPCPICGSTDYDMIIDYGADGAVIWCHKMTQPGNIAVGGKEYVCLKVGKQISIGTFNLYKEKTSYETCRERDRQAWIEEQKQNNPNWKPSINHKPVTISPSVEVSVPQPSSRVIEDVRPLSHRELDIRYRYFLSLLKLEEKHKTQLMEEWGSAIYPTIAADLLAQYPIRSMPPEDYYRFRSTEKLLNCSRKIIVAEMIKKFGSCEGIPGFFMRSGSGWDNKPASERWTFARGEGIIFPVYDKDGYLYRLRFRSDYPDKRIKEGAKNLYHGQLGIFRHRYSNDGQHLWLWYGKNTTEPIIASDVPLDKWGVPCLGKPQNKYKTLSSWYDKPEGNVTVNAMLKGCKSGSPYSLYIPKQCNYSVVIGTEGEKKAMVASYIKNVPTISIPGVGYFGSLFEPGEDGISLIDHLKSRGMKYFILCYDADKGSNDMVKNAEQACLDALKAAGVTPLVGEWSGKFDKGLDDILLMGIDIMTRRV